MFWPDQDHWLKAYCIYQETLAEICSGWITHTVCAPCALLARWQVLERKSGVQKEVQLASNTAAATETLRQSVSYAWDQAWICHHLRLKWMSYQTRQLGSRRSLDESKQELKELCLNTSADLLPITLLVVAWIYIGKLCTGYKSRKLAKWMRQQQTQCWFHDSSTNWKRKRKYTKEQIRNEHSLCIRCKEVLGQLYALALLKWW